MDLDEVRHKLTAGYERINNMKNSTEKIESCRANLRRKQESMLREVKAMMNYTAAHLHQLQLHMEARVREIVAERETHLDGKKKEIHDGYANLVQVCVEADKVLRGRHDDLLGRSCQRLFNNFEISKCKLDAAERIDVNAILGFELWNNVEMFLTNNCLAKIHFSDRTYKAEEFWVETRHHTLDRQSHRENKGISSVSNHGDCSNDCRFLSPEKSAGKNQVESQRQPLETIVELPEDSNTLVEQKMRTKGPASRPAFDFVRVREVDLSSSKESKKPESTPKDSSQNIPPPPGFSKLAIETNIVDEHDAHINVNSYKHVTEGLSGGQSLTRPNIKSDSCSPDGDDVKSWEADDLWDASGSISSPETSCTSAEKHMSFSSSSNSSRLLKVPAQASSKVKEGDIKTEALGREDEDFVWDSDDSAEISNSLPGSDNSSSASSTETSLQNAKKKIISDVETTKMKLIPIPQFLLSREQTFEVPQAKQSVFTGPKEEASTTTAVTDQLLCKYQYPGKNEKEPTKSPHSRDTAMKQNSSCEEAVTMVDHMRKDQIEEAASSRVNEVPRLIKTRSRRLDLSLMLDANGDQINAKCVEKIRGDFDHPIGVCTNSKGDVIVADTGNHIVKICSNGRVVHKFGADLGMRRPSAVVVNEKDEIFVKDDQCLYHFDMDGQHIKTLGKKKLFAPYGLGMTKDGKLVVVDDSVYSKARLHIFEQCGVMNSYSYQPLRYRCDESKCRFLAVYGEEVLTSDLGLGCLYLTNLKGQLLNTFGKRGKRPGELNQPAGIAVDNVGNWIVADSKNHRVQVFDRSGHFRVMLHFTGEAIHRPSGIHLTSDGLLYVINYVGSVIGVFKLGAS